MKRVYQKKMRAKELNRVHGSMLSVMSSKFIHACTSRTEDDIKGIYKEYKNLWVDYATKNTNKKSGIIVNTNQFDTHIAEFYNKINSMASNSVLDEYKRICEVVLEKIRVSQLASFLKNALVNPDKKIG